MRRMTNMDFSHIITDWYRQNKRSLPWRDIKDPYRIWISEIILQQTQVAQGYEYYLRFVGRFPNVKELASADETEVLRLWQGLLQQSTQPACRGTADNGSWRRISPYLQ